MKIALVAQSLDERRGGAETSTLQLARHLLRAGMEVHLVTQFAPVDAQGMIVHRIGGIPGSRTLAARRFTRGAARLIQRAQFDVVHAISPVPGADVYQPRGGTIPESIRRNLALCRTAPGRFSKSVANFINRKQRHLLALERRMLLDPNGPLVVAISEYVARQLREHYRLPDRRIRVVFNGVDSVPSAPEQHLKNREKIRRELALRTTDCLVILVAHNFRLKGVARWMEAHFALHQRGVADLRSAVIGNGPLRSWRQKAAAMGLADWITFVGPKPKIQEYLDAADILVHPTYYDPCSRVVLEALATGLPCVTTKWDGAAEQIEDGQNGFVIDDPADTTTLADRVDRLRDPQMRSSFSDAARDILGRISMAGHARNMIAIYDELKIRGL